MNMASYGLTRTKAIIIIFVIVILASVSVFLIASEIAGNGYLPSLPPTCSGYPPGGTCHAPYSYTFTININYIGPWVLNYYGFHNGEAASPQSNAYYLASGAITGNGDRSIPVTLSGDNYYFLNLCAWAQKLDYSNSTLTLQVTGSNSTSTPRGSTFYCGGVAP